MLLLLVLAAVPAVTTPAWACSCEVSGGRGGTDQALVGVVRSVRATGTEPPSCGARFVPSARHQVFAQAGRTDLCQGTQLVKTGFRSGDQPAARSPMRWPLILATGAGVLLLVIAGELWWLSRQPELLAEPRRRVPAGADAGQ
ncbi:hypothetical protein BJY16_001593 [Actinoplanes octamycinicus]|uniref:Uncharacterized protein n=1 Tax=Actinoplanes octamycinicus TaxID=135948 RepID=A0A7W7GTQ0_9ACTN|nr:hypothetical protein [Actinoplanes octamycinicus]MBB4738134.1 hypothetical protein [Actinoplanes octamycinicus]